MAKKFFYRDYHIDFLDSHNDKSLVEMTRLFNLEFNCNVSAKALNAKRKRAGLSSSKKWILPRTAFKPGHETYHNKPLGAVRLDKDGRQYIKVIGEDGKPRWRTYSQHLWEVANGQKLDSKRWVVIFRRTDLPNNYIAENLVAVEKSVNAVMNRLLTGISNEFIEIKIKLAKAIIEKNRIKRGGV